MGMCPSPPLIAAFHVLHRLKVPRHSPHALSSLTIKLVHKQNSRRVPDKAPADRNAANKQLDHYLFHLQFFATCRFSTMYSVVKDQLLHSTSVENKTFSRKKALFRTVISIRH